MTTDLATRIADARKKVEAEIATGWATVKIAVDRDLFIEMADEIDRLTASLDATKAQLEKAREALPEKLYVISYETGEHSDYSMTPILYALTEQDAVAAVELADKQKLSGDYDKVPYKHESPYGYFYPDGSEYLGAFGTAPANARWTEKPNAKEIEAQNLVWAEEHKIACLSLGHVDPGGCASWKTYRYDEVGHLRTAARVHAETNPAR